MPLLDTLFHPVREMKRRALRAEPFPDEWVAILNDDVAHYTYLSDDEKARLHDDLRCFVEEKTWEAGGDAPDHTLIDEMKVAIAAQACLLLLGWDDAKRVDLFPNVSTIIVYPSGYRATDRQTLGIVQTEAATGRLGEAWNGNLPVVLSWQSAREGGENPSDGHNVVLHEFAHKLDMQSGSADGVPRLLNNDVYDAWANALSAEYAALQHDAETGRRSFLDHYGATNEAEFFAVATEAFFEKPVRMRDEHTALYAAFIGFYEQDTAARVEAATEANQQVKAEDEEGYGGWRLLLEEKAVGYLYERGVDQPFFFCDFEPTPEFAAYAPLFAEEARLLKADFAEGWPDAYARIEVLKPRLVGVGFDEEINELLLHIEGDTAWFRY